MGRDRKVIVWAWAVLLGLGTTSAHSAADDSVPKAQWAEHMETTTPVFMCQRDSAWRTCYSISAQQCEEDIASATRVCLRKLDSRIPTTLVRSQGVALGSEIGECVTEAFAAVHEKDERDTADCKAAVSKLQREMSESSAPANDATPSNSGSSNVASNNVTSSDVTRSKVSPSNVAPSNASASKSNPSRAPQDAPRAADRAQVEDLYTLVDRDHLDQYWRQVATVDEPHYPMAVRSGTGTAFCVAVGFAIGRDGLPSNVHTLRVESDGMSSALQEQVSSASEAYVKGFRYSASQTNAGAEPVFTYSIFGRYRYMHGASDTKKKDMEYQVFEPCNKAGKAALETLRSRTR